MSIELPVIEGGTEIGRIDLKSGEVTVAPNLVSWSCCMDGDCCRRFQIPVTDFDILRIEEQGYELDQIVSEESPFIRMPKNQFGSVEKNYPIKRKPFDNSCTFLADDGKCGIHPFRPFSCRIYPFQYRFDEDDIVRITIHETVCHKLQKEEDGGSQNREFLEYLRDELVAELDIRDTYFEKYGNSM
ncbi:MAG: YkgJ family cysteine cluster protein [Candidatus Kariarchaeaceae archaeon]|jgi:Fe-S-cluster containining protein